MVITKTKDGKVKIHVSLFKLIRSCYPNLNKDEFESEYTFSKYRLNTDRCFVFVEYKSRQRITITKLGKGWYLLEGDKKPIRYYINFLLTLVADL